MITCVEFLACNGTLPDWSEDNCAFLYDVASAIVTAAMCKFFQGSDRLSLLSGCTSYGLLT